jgi:hypothetical protein
MPAVAALVNVGDAFIQAAPSSADAGRRPV